ncbi:MAG: hypothetical protein ABJK39_03000, partial [Hyphomicrobiales bacterium]
ILDKTKPPVRKKRWFLYFKTELVLAVVLTNCRFDFVTVDTDVSKFTVAHLVQAFDSVAFFVPTTDIF